MTVAFAMSSRRMACFLLQLSQKQKAAKSGNTAAILSTFRGFSSSSKPAEDLEWLKGSSNRQFSSSSIPSDDLEEGKVYTTAPANSSTPESQSAAVRKVDPKHEHQRIWMPNSLEEPLFWSEDVVSGSQHSYPHNLSSLLERIEKQEIEGGRMRAKQYGVLHEDPAEDMRLLTENYTVTSLATALRDREDVLQYCSQLAAENNFEDLKKYLENFHPSLVLERRNQKRRLDVNKPLNATSLETIRKTLMRMPRRVTQAHSRRAGVVIAICHVDGVPSLLLEKRSASLRAHPDEVCLPGGMVCSVADKTIVETCLREMKEEIGGLDFDYHQAGGSHGVSVLGVLRCNWGEVHHMVGVAVTPVVCFLGQDLAKVDLQPNPDEVAEVFTIPLASLFDKSQWIYKDDHAPIFIGGPYVIWGLTGYILERFLKDVLLPFNI
jgi:8-oxo-dGTP pyrophosphatase MutT (NUDIX family)